MALAETFKEIAQIGMRLDIIELVGSKQGRDQGPSLSASFGSGERVVLAPERGAPVRLNG